MRCWLWYCLLARPLCAGTITLSSSKYPALLYPMWYHEFLTCGDTTYISIEGSRPSQEPFQILEWKQDRVVSIFQSSPRENIYKAYSQVMSEDCEQFFLGAYFGGGTYSFDLSGKFQMVASDGSLSEALFVYKGGLVRAGKNNTGAPLKVLSGTALPGLERINQRLRKVPPHPVDGRFNFNKTVLAHDGTLLALAYCIQPEVFLFNLESGELVKIIRISGLFPGYLPPSDTFPVKNGPDLNHRTITWFSSFHILLSLRAYENKIYAFFRKGYESQGVWAELGGSYIWDNDKQATILMDITPEGCILGTTTGQSSDEVLWTLRRSNTLPKAPAMGRSGNRR